jgi:hypothetical protein
MATKTGAKTSTEKSELLTSGEALKAERQLARKAKELLEKNMAWNQLKKEIDALKKDFHNELDKQNADALNFTGVRITRVIETRRTFKQDLAAQRMSKAKFLECFESSEVPKLFVTKA